MSKTVLDQFAGGISTLLIGAPGSGKSHALGTIAELVDPSEIVLIAPKPNEINSALYRKHGLDKAAHVFRDHRWRPAIGMWEADGYMRLMTYLYELYEDTEHSVVLFDPLTDAVNLAAHDLLKAEQAATPRDLRDSIGFYGALKYKLKDLVQSLVGLSSPDLPRPKHVFATVHAQPTKEEDIKNKETAEGKAKGIEFFGDALPMIEGGYRREIASEFDIVGFTTVAHEFPEKNGKPDYKAGKEARYLVQLAPDSERHAKVRLAESVDTKDFPNHLPSILKTVLG